MLGIALGVAASVSWGISDFLGGLQSRRFSAFSVLLVSQPVGAVLAFAVAFAVGETLPADEFLLAAAGGAAVMLGLGAFYRGMALGSISVVATVGALGVLIPIAAGLVQGERPGGIQVVGALLAIFAVVLVAREPDAEWREANRQAVGLAGIAALGFGLFLLLIESAAEHDAAWAVAAARTGGIVLLAPAVLYARPALPLGGRSVLLGIPAAIVAIGVFDVLANSLYAEASRHGLLSLVSVAASLYAAVTVLLARVVLAERLDRTRQVGVALALVGVGLIASGA